MTRGHKSSERKACYHAFYAGLVLAGLAIWKNVDLMPMAALIGAINMPLMWYAGNRTALKRVQGEPDA